MGPWSAERGVDLAKRASLSDSQSPSSRVPPVSLEARKINTQSWPTRTAREDAR